MRPGVGLALATLTVLVPLAGCAGGSAAPLSTSPSTTAPVPTVTDDTGSIAGLVLDDELTPIPGVQIGAQGPTPSEATSDSAGRFTLNDLLPGSYTLFAQKLGYESEARRMDVVAGNTSEVTISVTAISLAEPRSELTTYDGYVDGDVYTAGVGVYYARTFPVNFTTGAQEIVVSMQWDASVPVFARYFRESVTAGETTNRTTGRSPLTTNITDFEVEKEKDKAIVNWGVTFGCGVDPMCFVNNPDALVPQIAYQQRVHFFNTVFYYQYAPVGYTGLPE